jgi:hypothetical protein
VVALPGVKRPKALGFLTDEIHHNISIELNGERKQWIANPE